MHKMPDLWYSVALRCVSHNVLHSSCFVKRVILAQLSFKQKHPQPTVGMTASARLKENQTTQMALRNPFKVSMLTPSFCSLSRTYLILRRSPR